MSDHRIMKNHLLNPFKAAIIGMLLSISAPSATELTFTLSDFTLADSSSRRTRLMLDGIWQYKNDEGDGWINIRLPVPFRLREFFIVRKQFALDSSMLAQHYEMAFQGIDGQCTVYLNKKIVGTHMAGSAPFTIPIERDELFFNELNELIIQVDTRLDHRKSLPMLTRNRGIPVSGDGLFRPIVLHAGRAPYVSALSIRTAEGIAALQGQLSALIQMGPTDSLSRTALLAGGLRSQLEVLDGSTLEPLFTSPALPILITAPDTVRCQLDFSVPGFVFWQPRQPHRYLLRLQLSQGAQIIDRVTVPLALAQPQTWLRQSRTLQGGFRYQIIEWVEDEAFRLSPLESQRTTIEKDMAEIVALGANTVRIPGNAPPPYLLEVCDRLGLAVLVEIPVTHVPTEHLRNATVRMHAKKALQGLISAYQAHPCVAAWGLGSGFDGGDVETAQFLREMAAEARKLDERPLFAGVRGKNSGMHNLPVDFQIIEVPPEELYAISQWFWKAQGFYILQFISPLPALAGEGLAAQNNQAFNLKRAFQEAARRQEHIGISVSPLRDWRGDAPHTYWGPRENIQTFTAGLFAANGQQRQVYHVVRAAFTNTSMPELLPGDVPVADPAVFQILSIALIVLLLFFIRRDKRLSHYIKRVFVYSHGFYSDLNENRQINPFLTGLIGLSSFLTLATLLASFVFFLRDHSLFDEILTWLFSDGAAKIQAIQLIWHPERLILFFTGALLGLAFLQAVIYKIFAMVQRRYLRFSQIVTFVLWVPANFIFALPLAVVLFRALSRSSLISFSLIYFLIIFLWYLLRAIRGAKVIMQVSAGKALLLQLAGMALVFIMIALYLEQSRALFAYANYYWSLLGL